METILSLILGVSLSAACGFRIFVPMCLMSLAAMTGHLTLAPGFSWIGSSFAFTVFTAATVLEVAAYYVPWLDNFLDTLATPASVVAGTVVTASVLTGMSPELKWVLAMVAGGGAAAVVQGATVLTRGVSSLTTGGLGNSAVATAELGGAVVTSGLALVLPLAALGALTVLVGLMFWRWWRQRNNPTVPPLVATGA